MPTSIIWVTHPVTGQEINVAPFVFGLAQFDAPSSTLPGAGASLAIARCLRVLNLTAHNPALNNPDTVVDVYQDLHRLQDMFDAITLQQIAS